MKYTIEALLKHVGKGFVAAPGVFFAASDVDYDEDDAECHLLAWRCKLLANGMIEHPVLGVTSPKDKRVYEPMYLTSREAPDVRFTPDEGYKEWRA